MSGREPDEDLGEHVLNIVNLTVSVGETPALEGVSFDIPRGSRVGLIGESGSGKTLTALSIMGLLPDGLTATGSIVYNGQELLEMKESELCNIRGEEITMVFQEPMTALNPVMRIGNQVEEVIRLHRNISDFGVRKRAVQLLTSVQLPDARERMDSYPHQLSGGQRQRVVIALALACSPALIIADEPTTALDVTVQAQILLLLRELVVEHSSSLLLITHDLAVVANMCEEVVVMYGGRVVETGPTAEVFEQPQHPYTAALLAAVPEIEPGQDRRARLPTIEGVVPGLGQFPSGCVFRDRCDRASTACIAPPTMTGDGDRAVACFNAIEPVIEEPAEETEEEVEESS